MEYFKIAVWHSICVKNCIKKKRQTLAEAMKLEAEMKGEEVWGEKRKALSPDEEREMYENENMEDEEIEKGKGSSLR